MDDVSECFFVYRKYMWTLYMQFNSCVGYGLVLPFISLPNLQVIFNDVVSVDLVKQDFTN